ncbi:RICIN domain-containing protein [Streptomyces sp. NPDC059063]|uniref:RICIN domain-containing protein n=1 Tax=unclassified Streptomyces TaxID=2593676 RepID=UPI0036BCC40D
MRKTYQSVGLLAAVGLAITFASVSSSASADTARKERHKAAAGSQIVSNYNNRCLNVAHLNTGDGASVQMYDCDGSPSRLWTRNGTGYRSDLSNKCLEPAIDNGDNGAAIQVFGCAGLPRQGWHWNGTELHSDLNHRCLTIAEANWWQGASVILKDCSGASHQQWHAT